MFRSRIRRWWGLDALSRREYFTGADGLLFGNEAGEHADGTRSATGSTPRSAPQGSVHLSYLELPSEDNPEGIDLPRIQRWMGHANIQTTMRYLHYVPAHDDAARLTAAFEGEAGTETGTEPPTPVPNSGQVRDAESAQ